MEYEIDYIPVGTKKRAEMQLHSGTVTSVTPQHKELLLLMEEQKNPGRCWLNTSERELSQRMIETKNHNCWCNIVR